MLRNFLRQFDQRRRHYTAGLSTWAWRWLGRDRVLCDKRLAADEIKRILVVRNNKRIGNMYFLLPFLHQLRQAYPDAQIDLMVINASQARIFEHMPLGRVWVSNFSFATAYQFFQCLRQCRAQPYDLLFMPHPSSTDILIGGLLHARNKVSFASDRVNAVYRHAIEAPHASAHAAKTPLALIDSGPTQDHSVNHLMALTEQERTAAQHAVMSLKGDAKLCFAYFRGARGKKIISDNDWLAIRQRFEQASTVPIAWVEILSPDITTPLTPETPTWQSKDLRQLGAFLAACDLFICGDTGPLHLADAAGARCLGLFTATSPVHYGCMGKDCVNVTDLTSLPYERVLADLGQNTHASPHPVSAP
jgi:ADP-heptose:LPS heptosyltransferase